MDSGAQSTALTNVNIGTELARGTLNFAKRHKTWVGAWVFGLLLSVFGTGLRVTVQQQREYSSLMQSIDSDMLQEAQQDYYAAEAAYRRSAGWFTCDSRCKVNRDVRDRAYAVMQQEEAAVKDVVRKARGVLGMFSEDNVQEVRGMFWRQFAGGKQYAKRASMYDVIFFGVTMAMGRDETLWEFLLRVLMRVLMNVTVGITMALFGFLASAFSFCWSYAPDPVTGALFFGACVLAAASVVVTYLVGVWVVGIGTAVVAGQASGNLRSLPSAQQHRAYIRNGHLGRGTYGRSHYD